MHSQDYTQKQDLQNQFLLFGALFIPDGPNRRLHYPHLTSQIIYDCVLH